MPAVEPKGRSENRFSTMGGNSKVQPQSKLGTSAIDHGIFTFLPGEYFYGLCAGVSILHLNQIISPGMDLH